MPLIDNLKEALDMARTIDERAFMSDLEYERRAKLVSRAFIALHAELAMIPHEEACRSHFYATISRDDDEFLYESRVPRNLPCNCIRARLGLQGDPQPHPDTVPPEYAITL